MNNAYSISKNFSLSRGKIRNIEININGNKIKSMYYYSIKKLAELVEQMYDERSGVSIKTAPFKAAYPLSYAQTGIWLKSRYLPNSKIYNSAFALKIKKKIDVKNLHEALKVITGRHEVLRTKFVENEYGQPFQVIEKDAKLNLKVFDLSKYTSKERENKYKDIKNKTSYASYLC